MQRRGQGYDAPLWLALTALAAVVLVPTVALLWFMFRAIENESLAMAQRFEDLATEQLRIEGQDLVRSAEDQLAELPGYPLSPALFGKLILERDFDGAVLFDAEGQLVYPAIAIQQPAPPPEGMDWRSAEQAEFRDRDFTAAAEHYGKFADDALEPALAALARLAQIRCLLKGGQLPAAMKIYDAPLTEYVDDTLRECPYTGASGHALALSAGLLLIEALHEAGDPLAGPLHERLTEQVLDYELFRCPPSQRALAAETLLACIPVDMNRVVPLRENIASPSEHSLLKRAAAAEHSSQRLAEHLILLGPPEPGLRRAPIEGLAQISFTLADDSTVSALKNLDALQIASSIAERRSRDWKVSHLLPGDPPPEAMRASHTIVDWPLAGLQLFLSPDADTGFHEFASRRIALYRWAAGLTVALIALCACATACIVLRQVRQTQMRNDLLATVSHELKTPLASMRVLLDTLRADRCTSEAQRAEYLELTARENTRLSRLIDNFLTYSQMERKKAAFHMEDVAVGEVVRQAVEAAGERFQNGDCTLKVGTIKDLHVHADIDALVGALLNLLDNAYKYNDAPRNIQLDVSRENGNVLIKIEDNGIGMAITELRRIKRPFYQVDMRLARRVGGCGLGLSIVERVLRAHGGTLAVESTLGRGSTFTLVLPSID